MPSSNRPARSEQLPEEQPKHVTGSPEDRPDKRDEKAERKPNREARPGAESRGDGDPGQATGNPYNAGAAPGSAVAQAERDQADAKAFGTDKQH